MVKKGPGGPAVQQGTKQSYAAHQEQCSSVRMKSRQAAKAGGKRRTSVSAHGFSHFLCSRGGGKATPVRCWTGLRLGRGNSPRPARKMGARVKRRSADLWSRKVPGGHMKQSMQQPQMQQGIQDQ